MGSPPKWELKYLLGSFVCDRVIKSSSLEKKRRVQSVTNIGLFGLALRYMWTKVKLK